MGYPVVQTLDGQRAVAETTLEKRYPTEFEPPSAPQNSGGQPLPAESPTPAVPLPNAFETRNVGVTLEVEPHVLQNGKWIRLELAPMHVSLIGFDSYDVVKMINGNKLKIDQPLFFTTKTNATVTLRNGQRNLLAVHKLVQPDDQLELFIVQAWAESIK